MNHAARLERLRREMDASQLEAIAVWSPENRFYLSGFSGSAGTLLVTRQEQYILTDFRYLEQARTEAPGFTLRRQNQRLGGDLATLLAEESITRLGLEAELIPHAQFLDLQEQMPGLVLEPTRGLVERLRRIKDSEELECLKKAVDIADQAFLEVAGRLKPGLREIEVAAELEYVMRRLGAERASFATIVASGPRSSLPHGIASERRLAEGDLVVMDLGAVYLGYCSDLTRTLALGRPTERQQDLYNLVLEAQGRALDGLHAGLSCAGADAMARGFLASRGYGDAFGHSLGHGVGLAVHELPHLAASAGDKLEAGMTVTVEPGLYLEGWGGIRIEDLVVVEENGCQVLSAAPKGLTLT